MKSVFTGWSVRWGMVLAAACGADEVPIGPDGTTSGQGGGTSSVGAGGSDTGPKPGDSGGSRLKAIVYEGEDGSSQSAGFFDSEEGVDCDFRMAADEKLRCLPLPPPGVAVMDGG